MSDSMGKGLQHRLISGWISDFSSVPRQEPWPSITLDKQLVSDLYQAFAYAQRGQYTGVILWGLLCGRSWAPHLPDTATADRLRQVREIIDVARRCGLQVLVGLGVYSWGFDQIVAEHPELDGGMARVMCGQRAESDAWMQRVVDFVMAECDPDGLSLQSADQGRCPCDACQEMDSLSYHAMLNERVTSYVRRRWSAKLIEVSTWGIDLGGEGAMPAVQRLVAHADILSDYNNSAGRRGTEQRRAFIASLPCAYGTASGWWLDTPPYWERDRWFLPFALRNVNYMQTLVADGARSVQRYILPIANPGGEVGLLFDGLMLADVHRDPVQTLRDVLQEVYEPRTAGSCDALMKIWRTAESAYLDNAREGSMPQEVGLTRVHYNYVKVMPPYALAERPEYLMRMRPTSLERYASALEECLALLRKVRPELGNGTKAARLERTLQVTLAEVLRVRGWKSELT
ncbi:MAG: hypothetical protein ACUVX9_05025 [Anaerolineae bacterium]